MITGLSFAMVVESQSSRVKSALGMRQEGFKPQVQDFSDYCCDLRRIHFFLAIGRGKLRGFVKIGASSVRHVACAYA
jgi:hypothetical protein